jgi:8-oxo-dGTP pyrophosphatase MutT (NUDIX family)
VGLLETIARFQPHCEQEERDRAEMLRRLRAGEDLLWRTNESAHFTASAWVCNDRRDRVLMCYHRLYGSWSWLGGHADGDADLLGVALREVTEESGLSHLRPISTSPCSLETLCVEGHMKDGAYVPCHLHLNLTFLIEADEDEALHVALAENSALRWFSCEGAVEASSEPWFRRWVYPKLNERLRELDL